MDKTKHAKPMDFSELQILSSSSIKLKEPIWQSHLGSFKDSVSLRQLHLGGLIEEALLRQPHFGNLIEIQTCIIIIYSNIVYVIDKQIKIAKIFSVIDEERTKLLKNNASETTNQKVNSGWTNAPDAAVVIVSKL